MKNIKWLVLSVLLILTACQQEVSVPEKTESEQTLTLGEIVEPELEQEPEEKEVTITVGAIGDVLLHGRVYDTAKVEGGYDFMPMLAGVQGLLQEPDFMMANQESMPGGVELGLSTYPAFNSPHEIVDHLQMSGIDMVIGANNHTLDRGYAAIESALNYYDEIGMSYVGVYRDTEDRNMDRIVTVDDITMGILAYTYGTNGIPIPSGHEDVVALIEQERMVQEVKKLREKVDVVIVHMHWGPEYEREPSQEQRQWAAQLAEAGTDIIFGHHPHVLQPIDVIEQESGHETTVFYSLGNFLSGQKYDYTDIGGVGTIEITKRTKGDEVTIDIHSPEIEPTLVLRNSWQVLPLSEATDPAISGSTHSEMIDHVEQYITQ